MAVRVKHGQLDNTGRFETVHEKADDFNVQDGHLFVTGWGGASDVHVAVYRPSTWLNAVVEGNEGT